MIIDDVSSVGNIRKMFVYEWNRHVRGDVEVAGTLEIVGSSFIADEESIFGRVDREYVQRELDWYLSQSLDVHDIPGGPPAIWKSVADEDGLINSNYGYLLFSSGNWKQYMHVVDHLLREPEGRRAVAIYTRPEMHVDWNARGRRDFICTNAVNYYLRDGHLHAVVQMRSNDAVYGYRNDYAWQRFIMEHIAAELEVDPGSIIWQAGSLHVYARHYHLIERFAATGEWDVPVTTQSQS